MAISKVKLSESTDGKGIKVVATATAGTAIHTCSTVTEDLDEIWLYAYNSHTAPVALTIEFGGTTDPDNLIVQTIPQDSGLYLVVPGLILAGAASPLSVAAFAGSANVISITGFVNRISQ